MEHEVFIVTGGTAGIGFGISAHILQHKPAKLYLLGKKEEHGEEAQKELEKYGDVSKVEFVKCDLEDLKQVDGVAKELAKLDQIDAVSRTIVKSRVLVTGLTMHYSLSATLVSELVNITKQEMA